MLQDMGDACGVGWWGPEGDAEYLVLIIRGNGKDLGTGLFVKIPPSGDPQFLDIPFIN